MSSSTFIESKMIPYKYFIVLLFFYYLLSSQTSSAFPHTVRKYHYALLERRENSTSDDLSGNETLVGESVQNSSNPSSAPIQQTPGPTNNSSLEAPPEEKPNQEDESSPVQSQKPNTVHSSSSKISYWTYLVVIVGVLLPPLFIYLGVREYQKNNLRERRVYPFLNTRISDIEVSDEAKNSLAHS